ncbi:MAG: hypothetical protein IT325_13940 [Anaerolineae bacterium]|nr:hypothetical protein [Anaerolineae bacterium]
MSETETLSTPAPDPGSPAGATPEHTPGETSTPPPLHAHPEFKDRIEQAKRAGARDLLATLGFAGVDTPDGLAKAQEDLSGLVEFARQQRDATLTAEQKLAEQIAALTSERDQAAAERDRLTQVAEQARQDLDALKVDQLRVAAVETAATGAGAARPGDVVMWARSHRPSEFGQVLGEDQAVHAERVQALIAACVEARPEWFAARTPGSPSHAGAKALSAPPVAEQQKELARQTVRRGMR